MTCAVPLPWLEGVAYQHESGIWHLAYAGSRLSNNGKLRHIHSALRFCWWHTPPLLVPTRLRGSVDGQPINSTLSDQQPRLLQVENSICLEAF